MDHLQLAAGILGLSANYPLIRDILSGKATQNFATFLLWASLDIIAAVTTRDGNFILPAAYAISGSTVATILAIKKQVSWSWIETGTTILVIACLILWKTKGEEIATVASSSAVVIATFPQARDTWKKPEETPVSAYLMFLVANSLSFYAGKAWTIDERLYSGCVTFLCLTLVIFSLRKGWNTRSIAN